MKNEVKIMQAAACKFFIPFFTVVYIQTQLILQKIYVLNKEILQKDLRFIIKSNFKSKAGYSGARMVVEFLNGIIDFGALCLRLE